MPTAGDNQTQSQVAATLGSAGTQSQQPVIGWSFGNSPFNLMVPGGVLHG